MMLINNKNIYWVYSLDSFHDYSRSFTRHHSFNIEQEYNLDKCSSSSVKLKFMLCGKQQRSDIIVAFNRLNRETYFVIDLNALYGNTSDHVRKLTTDMDLRERIAVKIEKLFDFDTALLFSEGLEDLLTKTTKKKFVNYYQVDEPFK